METGRFDPPCVERGQSVVLKSNFTMDNEAARYIDEGIEPYESWNSRYEGRFAFPYFVVSRQNVATPLPLTISFSLHRPHVR